MSACEHCGKELGDRESLASEWWTHFPATCRDVVRARLAEVERERDDARKRRAASRAIQARAERAEAEVERLRAVAEAAERYLDDTREMHRELLSCDALIDALAAHAQGADRKDGEG